MNHSSNFGMEWDCVMQFIQEPTDLVSEHSSPPALSPPIYTDVELTRVPKPQNTYPHTETLLCTMASSQDSFQTSAAMDEHEDDPFATVSTTFFPGSQIHSYPPDLILLSSDSVYFYVGYNVLFNSSSNAFNRLLSSPKNHPCHESVVMVPEHSVVLNIVLHTVYNMSCSHYAPAFESLSSGVEALYK